MATELPAYNIEPGLICDSSGRQTGACHRGGPSSWHSLRWRFRGGNRSSMRIRRSPACRGRDRAHRLLNDVRLDGAPTTSEVRWLGQLGAERLVEVE
jgi:hypothetical protein